MKKLRELINDFEKAAREEEMKDCRTPEEADEITKHYENSKYELSMYIARLASDIENMRKYR